MGTVFAGIIRAPMTSVLMIFEITQDYQILVPLMVANLLSFVIARRYQREPLYHALLRQDGIHVPSPASRSAVPQRVARDVMSTDLSFVDPQTPIASALERAAADAAPALLVGTGEALVAVVSKAQLLDAVGRGDGARPVGTLSNGDVLHAHADHPLEIVLDRLAQSPGLLPIVSREQFRRVEGAITLDDLVRLPDRPASA
jgi:CIC family chloride channel protein